jgi:iron complex transport system substrate-binding protein
MADNQSKTGEEEDYYEFTDSLGRKVMVPYNIKRIIPSGVFAQTTLCTLCPEKLASVASTIDEGDVEAYQRAGMEHVATLPKTGAMYSRGQNAFDTSKVATIDADIIVDIGYHKDDLGSRLNDIQDATAKPAVSTDGVFGSLPQVYRVLGPLLGYESRAKALASYIEEFYSKIEAKRENVTTSPKVLYVGNAMRPRGNSPLQNKVMEYLGGTPVVSPDAIMDIEFIIQQGVDYVIFFNHDNFHSILNKQGEVYEKWSSVPAIQKNCYAVVPALFHSWIGSPLLVQTILLPWLGNLLWPGVYDFDLVELTRGFYDFFFNYKMSDDEAVTLIGWNARGDA